MNDTGFIVSYTIRVDDGRAIKIEGDDVDVEKFISMAKFMKQLEDDGYELRKTDDGFFVTYLGAGPDSSLRIKPKMSNKIEVIGVYE